MGKTQQLRTPEATFSTCTKQERAPGWQGGEERTTVSMIRTCENLRMPVSLPQTGASCKSSTRRESVIRRNTRDQPTMTWEDLAGDLEGAGSTVSMVTLSYTIRCHGLQSCGSRKAPFITPAHVQTRMKPAREHLDEPGEAWEKVLWSEGTKIEPFGINSTCHIWKKKDESSSQKIIPSVQLGGWEVLLCKQKETTAPCCGENRRGHIWSDTG